MELKRFTVEYGDGISEIIYAVNYDEALKHAKVRADFSFTSVLKVEPVK
jgi:hypothetical protein